MNTNELIKEIKNKKLKIKCPINWISHNFDTCGFNHKGQFLVPEKRKDWAYYSLKAINLKASNFNRRLEKNLIIK